MPKIKFYVVTHPCGGFSVQTKETGMGDLLQSDHPSTREGAEIACNAANEALKIMEKCILRGSN
jgi:acetylornithine/succinyldiaminopimelate/putrescine aminotransferase